MADSYANFGINDRFEATFSEVIEIKPSGTKSVSYTENGNYTEDVEKVASVAVSVDVPNSYSAADEGKVVDGGELVEQTARTITENGQYDTTTNDNVNVNVPNPSTGTKNITTNGQHDVTDYATANVNVPNPSAGSLSITENGTYDVTEKASAVVNVPIGDEWEEVLLWQKPEEITSYEANNAFASFDRSFGSYEYVKLQITGQNATQLRTFIIKNDAAYWPVFIGTNRCCRGFGRNELLNGYEFTTNTLAYQLSDTAVSPRYNNRILPLSIHGIRKKTQ